MSAVAGHALTDEQRRVLSRWIDLLEHELNLRAVWLYGSRARGEGGADSDVDLLVVADGDERPWQLRRRAYSLLESASEEEGASFLPYSIQLWDSAYLEDRRRVRSFFLQEVDRDKIVLHGDP